ncbi:MAG TPA: SLAC1 anion channel family protein [Thiobacillus sp.]|uniref:SLAC1 anion channel family protein n=1 Tax=Polaromonas sp. TaxID=1869339 RepID=UPI000BD5B761|nr:SLAC1 anion channel family protein [Polaromonas sp.]OYW62975.1 MAG: C4-dicarboxylate ABC transporter [Hydrogenophilales bacterium 12-64-13]OYZ04047.1 MAG: C4-dicarboxylate ABC transporter [Hydrogenophilales bacterium 16-64-46]OZA36686.1 MAG: C4-dicarboxylate ABC transporter [Hydrogenophilales bacterium 17-64-34]HQS83097.1 SLAC1 anion channel family protein [Thiobacillus sp.]HQS89349.1 SLAC1 anion channel family protein [Polaromonas sp.]
MTETCPPETASRLKNFPVSAFSIIMGLAGFSIAWDRAEQVFDPGFGLSSLLLACTTILFVVLAVVYALKAVKHPGEVMGEIRHPVKLAFIPSISISLLLLSIAYLHQQPALSWWLWSIGSVVHLGITLYVLSSWIHHTKYEITHLNPAWFIPVVGNILIPIAGVHHAPVDVSWFFFSIGVFFWPLLTAIIFNRLIFHGSLPDRFMPTLFIFIAPPAVGFISWFNLTGEVDAFARVLYFTGLLFTLLLFAQTRYFSRLKFFLSWWAYSFPLAAMTIATLLMAKQTGAAFYSWLAAGLLGLLSLVIAVLIWRTTLAVLRKEICVEGH